MSSLVVYKTNDKIMYYRPLPISFEGYWKVGDTIKSIDGLEDCKIIEIIPNTLANQERLNQEKIQQFKTARTTKTPTKELQAEKLKYIIKFLNTQLSNERYSDYLKSEDLKAEDFKYSNIVRCFTRIILNEKKINCKIVKRNGSNVLTYDSLSNYLGCEIRSVDLELSILDKGYTYDFVNKKILLFKGNEVFTLKIIQVEIKDILSRLPKYMKEIKKRTA